MNKDKTIPKLWDNKVDKGGYTGTAQNLKSEIDSKVSKNGDTINGQLIVDRDNDSIVLKANGEDKGSICASSIGWLGIVNKETGNGCVLYDDGRTSIKANNLNTQEKEVIGAINELYNNSFMSNIKINGLPYDNANYFREIIKQGRPGSYYTGDKAIHGLPVGNSNYRNLLFSSTADVFQAFLGEEPFNKGESNLYYATSTKGTDVNNIKWVKIWHSGVMAPTVIQVNGIMGTTSNLNPAERAVGTTWTRIGEQNVGGTTVYYWKRNS